VAAPHRATVVARLPVTVVRHQAMVAGALDIAVPRRATEAVAPLPAMAVVVADALHPHPAAVAVTLLRVADRTAAHLCTAAVAKDISGARQPAASARNEVSLPRWDA